MNPDNFRNNAKDLIEWICRYREDISARPVCPPNIVAGFLTEKLPKQPPAKAETWDDIMRDVNDLIMPGVVHWQHPRFHAYFPSGNSFPSLMGELLQAALGIQSFTWAACPASHELEMVVLDWFAVMLGLPNHFLHSSKVGGGSMQGSASDSVLVTMIAARNNRLEELKRKQPTVQDFEDANYLNKFVVYCSDLAHLCVEKAAHMLCIKIRHVASDPVTLGLKGETLSLAVKEDLDKGLIPLYVCATLGTTSCTSCDELDSIGQVCNDFGLWLHIDAAYAGNALICEEFRHVMKGIEYVTSFSVNPHKWLMVNFDASLLWVKQVEKLSSALRIPAQYLAPTTGTVDFRHWQMPLSRRFRSLKLWFLLRCYGVSQLQDHIRYQCSLAKRFENLVSEDARFTKIGQVLFGLVCFKLKRDDSKESDFYNRLLVRHINQSGDIHLTPAIVKGSFVLRFCICYENSTEEHVDFAWKVISNCANDILAVNPKDASLESLQCDSLVTGIGISRDSQLILQKLLRPQRK